MPQEKTITHQKKMMNKIKLSIEKHPEGKPLTLQYVVSHICKKVGVVYLEKYTQKQIKGISAIKVGSVIFKEDVTAGEIISELCLPYLLRLAIKEDGVYLKKINDKNLLNIIKLANEHDRKIIAKAMAKLDDVQIWVEIAIKASGKEIQKAAVSEILDEQDLANIVFNAVEQEIVQLTLDKLIGKKELTPQTRKIILEKIAATPESLENIAKNASNINLAKDAMEKISDLNLLNNVASHSIHDSIRKAAADKIKTLEKKAETSSEKKAETKKAETSSKKEPVSHAEKKTETSSEKKAVSTPKSIGNFLSKWYSILVVLILIVSLLGYADNQSDFLAMGIVLGGISFGIFCGLFYGLSWLLGQTIANILVYIIYGILLLTIIIALAKSESGSSSGYSSSSESGTKLKCVFCHSSIDENEGYVSVMFPIPGVTSCATQEVPIRELRSYTMPPGAQVLGPLCGRSDCIERMAKR